MAKDTIDTLGVKIDNLTVEIAKLTNQFGSYMPSEVTNLKFAEVQRDILEMRKALIEHEKDNQEKYLDLEKKIQKSNWKSHTLTAALTFLMTFLTGFFLTNISSLFK
jgi:hypothetical protein